jgi:hypothetical protein
MLRRSVSNLPQQVACHRVKNLRISSSPDYVSTKNVIDLIMQDNIVRVTYTLDQNGDISSATQAATPTMTTRVITVTVPTKWLVTWDNMQIYVDAAIPSTPMWQYSQNNDDIIRR